MSQAPPTSSADTSAALLFIQYFNYYRYMEEYEAIRALTAIAHPARLQVFRALIVAGHGGLTPSALSSALGVPPTSLSFHLKELANAFLVTQERDGRHLIYRATYTRMNALLAYLTANCCAGTECVVNPAVGCANG